MFHCLLDPTGVIVWMSHSQPDIVFAGNIMGKKPWDFATDAQSRAILRAAFTKASIDREVVHDIECEVLNEKGQRIVLKAIYEPVGLPIPCVSCTYWEIPNELQELSPRETEILALIAQGYTTKQIAKQLDISISTVESHRTNAQSKTGLNTPTLIRLMIQSDLA